MPAIEGSVVTPIHVVDYQHKIGPIRWGRRIGDPIVIEPSAYNTGVTIREDGWDAQGGEGFVSKLVAIIEKPNPDTIIVGRTLHHSYLTIRTVTGVDINSDPQLKNRFFYQE